jgi:hypothetical protein
MIRLVHRITGEVQIVRANQRDAYPNKEWRVDQDEGARGEDDTDEETKRRGVVRAMDAADLFDSLMEEIEQLHARVFVLEEAAKLDP